MATIQFEDIATEIAMEMWYVGYVGHGDVEQDEGIRQCAGLAAILAARHGAERFTPYDWARELCREYNRLYEEYSLDISEAQIIVKRAIEALGEL